MHACDRSNVSTLCRVLLSWKGRKFDMSNSTSVTGQMFLPFAGFYCHEKAGNLTCQNQPLWQVNQTHFWAISILTPLHAGMKWKKNKKIKIKKMHAHLSNLGLLRCLFDWSFQWETSVGDLICPLLQFFCHLWKSCSSSINPCVDFSWTYNQMVDTQDRGEHKHNFAWKNI